MGEADSLLDDARNAVNRGSFARAMRLLDLADAAARDQDLRARVELTRAYAESETGRAGAGLERCRALLERPALEEQTRGLVHAQLGLLHMRLGDAPAALSAFDEALTLLPGRAPEAGRILLNRGNVHLQRLDPVAARGDFTAARDALDVPGFELQQAKAQHNLGYAMLLTGDLVGALRQMEQASTVLAPASAVSRAVGEQDRAEVLLAAGRPREAIRALEAAAAAYGSRRLRTFQADCELALAWTLLREDPARARVVARRAARRFRGQAAEVPALRADAAALVAAVSAGDTSRAVLSSCDDLARQLVRRGHRREAVLLRLQAVRVEVARGDLASAATRLRGIRLGTDAPVASRLLLREVQAELAQARGRAAAARRHVRAGLDDLHRWQSAFGSLDLQSTLVGHGRALALRGLQLAVAEESPTLLLEWSERARALVGRVSPVRPPADERLSADLAELRAVLADPAASGPARRARVEALRDRIRQHSWYGEGGGSVAEPAPFEDVRSALAADGAALVAHVVVDGRITALVLTDSSAEVVPLGDHGPLRQRLGGVSADLAMTAAHRTGGLAEAARRSLAARLDPVADQLVAPLLASVGDRRVVLTPSGALAGTPWSLLPGLVGRPLTVAPSATRWLSLRGRLPEESAVGFVAGPGLDRAEEEVAAAATHWPGARVLRGGDATSAAVARLTERVDVLHLAGHGTHPGENPLFSAVHLVDGPWFGYDIDQLPRTPRVVVLSACDLGRATVRSGEESVGMTAAWLHAGARTVLSSPVLLADDLACEVLSDWHALVAAGAAPADALATASARAGDVVPLLTFGAGW